jgi:hypothetical protein
MAERTLVYVALAGSAEYEALTKLDVPVDFQDLGGAAENEALTKLDVPVDFQDLGGAAESFNPFEGGSGPGVTTYYQMRVKDSGTPPPAGYRGWVTTDPASDPPPPGPVGVWVDRVILATWQA